LMKTLQQKAQIQEKGMAILVAKAACFELSAYKDVLSKELDTLLQWYGIDHKGMKKAQKVAHWNEIWAANTKPPEIDVWTAVDEENLVKIANKEINMLETFLGRYAALQKRNAVAAVLDFTDKEWKLLKMLKEADVANRSNTIVADAMDSNTGDC
jgi:hypothetical protein